MGSCGLLVGPPISLLAGQTTKVELAFLADFKFVLSVSVALLGVGWGAIERYLRHRKVAKMQERIRTLELRLDPNRTSSGLTPQGKTHPDDMED